MSEDLSKLHRMRSMLLDEDPTDCSPHLTFANHDNGPAPISGYIEITQARLTRLSPSEQRQYPANEMLERQKQKIAELRSAIEVMSSEIDLLHTALNDQIQSTTDVVTETEEPTIKGRHAATPVIRILLMLDGHQVLKYPLHRHSMTLGRSAENDIQIATEFVSRVHARITSDANGAVIEDMNSRNGVVINSKKVSRKKLSNGDIVALGKTQFKFIDLMEDSAGEGRA